MQLKLCATPRPLFKGNISIADCKLLDSPAASNVYEKLAILDEYLVDHC